MHCIQVCLQAVTMGKDWRGQARLDLSKHSLICDNSTCEECRVHTRIIDRKVGILALVQTFDRFRKAAAIRLK